MREREADLNALDVRVLAVTFESRRRITEFQQEDPLPYPLLRDPRREGYRRFGLGRKGISRIWGPETLTYYGRRLLQGQLPERVQGDAYQLGGDVILRPDLSGGWVYRSRHPADRPEVDEVLRMLDRARER